MVCDEDWDRGLSRDEGISIAQRLAASGLIDFVNVIRGHIDTEEALSHVIPGMGSRSAPHLDFSGEVRAATRMPTFHAARIQDVATARHAIESGKLDMVGMTRAHLADPHIARKVAEGREHEIRPCVGMGYCIDSIYSGQAVCIHNAATGREATIPHVITKSAGPKRKVVVVGAGPAGLEAARVAGERGHEVVVFEAAAEAVRRDVALAVLTRSEAGSVILRGTEMVEIPAEPTRVVDTTGAGDAYAAGFLAGLTAGRSLPVCGRMGSIAAAEVISHYGARPEADLKKLIAGRV